MPMGMGYGYYWDPTYVLVIIGAVICMIASANVSGTYKKYNRVRNSRNMTGAQVAAQILQEAGLSHIRIEHIRKGTSSVGQRLWFDLDRSSWCGGA